MIEVNGTRFKTTITVGDYIAMREAFPKVDPTDEIDMMRMNVFLFNRMALDDGVNVEDWPVPAFCLLVQALTPAIQDAVQVTQAEKKNDQ